MKKKVFITGITGFKGSWLALMLLEKGYNVYGLGLPQENYDSIHYQARIPEKVSKIFIEDIRNLPARQDIINVIEKCDYIYHLAAQPIVSVGYKQPVETMSVNVLGTIILQEILRKYSKKKVSFLNITTDKVYQPKNIPLKENDILQGQDPYSLSKSFSDMISQMYQTGEFKRDNILVSTVRAGNVIGGGDVAQNRIMVDIIKAIKEESILEIRNPESVRPYQHVLDCLALYIYIAEKQYNLGIEGSYNIGPTSNTIVKTIDLVENSLKFSKFYYEINKDSSIGKETGFLSLNTDKIFNEINKKPKYNTIEDIVKSTIKWYLSENKEEESVMEVKEVLEWWEA